VCVCAASWCFDFAAISGLDIRAPRWLRRRMESPCSAGGASPASAVDRSDETKRDETKRNASGGGPETQICR